MPKYSWNWPGQEQHAAQRWSAPGTARSGAALPSRAAATASTMVTLEQISRKVSPAVKLIPRAGSPAGHQRPGGRPQHAVGDQQPAEGEGVGEQEDPHPQLQRRGAAHEPLGRPGHWPGCGGALRPAEVSDVRGVPGIARAAARVARPERRSPGGRLPTYTWRRWSPRARRPTPTGSTPADVRRAAHARLPEILRRIGPGMILAAAIVGSGELIATTTLGAQEGYRLLWLILLSCLIKPIVQAELGRYTIATGEPTPGEPEPRARARALGKVGWVAWGWAIMVFITLLQVGAMFGGVAQVMHLLVPAVPVRAWVLVFLALTLAAAAGRRLRAHRAAGGGQGRAVHAADAAGGGAAHPPARLLLVGAWPQGLRFELPAARPGHRGGGLRRHRRRHQRAGHVPLLVRREGLRPLHRPARRQRGLDPPRARLDPGHARRHPGLADHLHRGHASPFTCWARACCTPWGWSPRATT